MCIKTRIKITTNYFVPLTFCFKKRRNGGKIQEVSFSPIVYSFFPERSERAKLVEEMVDEIYLKNDFIYETYFIIHFQNEY